MSEANDATNELEAAKKQIKDGLDEMNAKMTVFGGTIMAVVNALKQTGSIDMNRLMTNMEAMRTMAQQTSDEVLLAKVDHMIEGLNIEVLTYGQKPAAPKLRLIPTDPDKATPETDD